MTFLVDVNLPRFFSQFHNDEFIFVYNLNQELPDFIIFRFGNLKLNAMNKYFQQNWGAIYKLIQLNKVILAWPNEIEIVY